jgi:metal-dependent HD superfamily phosphatase/phosphodiesterase
MVLENPLKSSLREDKRLVILLKGTYSDVGHAIQKWSHESHNAATKLVVAESGEFHNESFANAFCD